jgi:hypothetical protein
LSNFQNFFTTTKLFLDVNYTDVIANAYADDKNKTDPFNIATSEAAAVAIKSVELQCAQKMKMHLEMFNKEKKKIQEGIIYRLQQAEQHEAGKWGAKLVEMNRRKCSKVLLEEDGEKITHEFTVKWLSKYWDEEVIIL